MILSLARIVKAWLFIKGERVDVLCCSAFTITTAWYIIKNVVFLLSIVSALSKRIKEKSYEDSDISEYNYDAGHVQFGDGQSGLP